MHWNSAKIAQHSSSTNYADLSPRKAMAGPHKIFNDSESADSPFSNRDPRERIIHGQRAKLAEMRKEQIEFFDAKMFEMNTKESQVSSRINELRELDCALQQREAWVENQLRRIEVEKAEIISIRDLLKAESAAMQMTASDMKSQIHKYDRLLRVRLTDGARKNKLDQVEGLRKPPCAI